MLLSRQNGATGVILRFKILDSSVTTGAGKTGLSSASTGLIISTIADIEATATAYSAAGATIDAVTTLGTYAAPTAGHCRFKEVDATNHPGVYELQLENARFAVSGAKSLLVSVQVTGGQQTDFVIDMAAASDLRTIAGAALDTTNAQIGVDVRKFGGTAVTPRDIGASVLLSAGTGTGQVSMAAGVVDVNVKQYGGVAGSFSAGIPSVNTVQWRGTQPNLLIAGRVDSNPGAIQAGVITSAAFATDAIDANALKADAATEIATAVGNLICESAGSYTLKQIMSVNLAVLCGVTSGGGNTLKTPDGTATRVAATTDSSNNRTAMTLTPSA
jgi:hypothetical protein